jgi:hypothetical protein
VLLGLAHSRGLKDFVAISFVFMQVKIAIS